MMENYSPRMNRRTHRRRSGSTSTNHRTRTSFQRTQTQTQTTTTSDKCSESILPNSDQSYGAKHENFSFFCEDTLFRVEKLMNDKKSGGFMITYLNQLKSFRKMTLTGEAGRVRNTPNAGGSSVESETLSCEMFRKCYNARLLKTEMEVGYFPEGGSITDYVLCLFDRVVGVSVTRAMKFDGAQFTVEDGEALLRKKLKGIKQSSKNSLLKWDKQILHVWTLNEETAFALMSAWMDLESDLKSNTVMVLTVAENSRELFVNKEAKKKKNKSICRVN